MTKICTKCGEEKELGDFGKRKRNKCGRSSRCKLCISKAATIRNRALAGRRRKRTRSEQQQDDKLQTQECKKCGIRKSYSSFYKRNRSKSGVVSQCKKCASAYTKTHPPKVDKDRWKDVSPDTLKKCSQCKEEKVIAKFPKNLTRLYGVAGTCRKCSNAAGRYKNPKQYVRSNDEKAHDQKVQSKVCTVCGERKSYDEYGKVTKREDGRIAHCKDCQKVKRKVIYWRDVANTRAKNRVANLTPTQLEQKRAREQKYHKKYPMAYAFRTLVRRSLFKFAKCDPSKQASWEKILGYTRRDLKAHLEAQFDNKMTWDNYGYKGWHIDHIRPVSSFTFKDKNDPEFIKCFSLENLMPRWSTTEIARSYGSDQIGNINKSNKMLKAM